MENKSWEEILNIKLGDRIATGILVPGGVYLVILLRKELDSNETGAYQCLATLKSINNDEISFIGQVVNTTDGSSAMLSKEITVRRDELSDIHAFTVFPLFPYTTIFSNREWSDILAEIAKKLNDTCPNYYGQNDESVVLSALGYKGNQNNI